MSVIGALGALLFGCMPEESRLVARRHLADEDAAARGDAEPGTAQLGDVTSYVLGPDPGRWELRSATTDALGTSRVEVVCEPGMVGRAVLVEVRTLPGLQAEHADVEPTVARRICPAHPATPIPIDVPIGGGGGTEIAHLVRVGRLPATRLRTGMLDVDGRDQLRLSVGVVGSGRRGREWRLVVRAVGSAGSRVSILRTTVPADDRWHDLVVPLGDARAALGSTFRLEFKRELAGDADRLAYVVIGNPTVWGPRARGSPPRSVVLISLDTLRADRLGTYGYPLLVSPVLDAVAHNGTVFDQAVAQASWTIPSHATMLTGTYSCVHGLGINEFDHRSDATDNVLGRPLPVGVRPLAEILRDAGYATAAFTENAFVDPASFQRGFDQFTADRRTGWAAGVVEETVRASVDWLRAHADEPFLLFVHTYQVHAPYAPPVAYDWSGDMEEFPVAPGGRRPVRGMEVDAARYVGEVAYTDAALAPLFASLNELGLEDRTIVVVTSDHGEAFGEQGGAKGHATNIVEEQIRVPLIWQARGLIAPGRRVPSLVGVVDIAPTLLALLGMEVPAWMQGVSLVPLLGLETPTGQPPSRLLPAEGYTVRGVRAANWKVTRWENDRLRVVTLSPTGMEWWNRRPHETQTVDAFAAVRLECERARGVLGDAGLARPRAQGAVVDPERERKLRALGYLE